VQHATYPDEASMTALVPARRDDASVSSPIRTADDLAAAFLLSYGQATREAYARDLRAWGTWLQTLGLEVLDAHRSHVELWARDMEMSGAAPATIARRLSTVSGFYRYAVDEDLIARSPVTRVRRPRTSAESPRSGLERDELRRLLTIAEASSPRDRALVTLLAFNGVRVSEAIGTDVADLDTERGHHVLRLRHRKGGKAQRIALPPRTAEAIDTLLAGRTTGPIFATSSGRRMDRQAARKVIARLARKAGIPRPVSPHLLRHTFVTLSLDAGVPLHVVQDGAGHASPATTRRYDSHRHSLDNAAAHRLAAYLAEDR
jgi:integrase/recombinase XerD